MPGLKISGAGFALPRNVVTNDDLKKFIDTSDEWIYSRTGIKTRHIIDADEAAHTLAIEASKKAIETAEKSDPDFSKDKIKAVIVGTMTSDYVFPSIACILQKELGLGSEIKAFDLSAACTSFVYALQTTFEILNAEHSGYVLTVGAECMSKVLNFKDRSTCVLFGDGAGSVIVRWDDSAAGVFKEVAGTEGNMTDLYCKNPRENVEDERADGYLHMNGGEVYKFATGAMKKAVQKLLDETGNTMDDIGLVVCHQANARIINHVKKRFPGHEDKFFMDLEHFANTSAASVGIALADAYERKLIRPGMKIILASFGAGLSWNGILMSV